MSKQTDYSNLIFKAKTRSHNRVMVAVPMTGLVRSEWAIARMAQVIPCNWSHTDHIHWMDICSPIGYAVAEARNVVVDQVIKHDFEWLLFIDHDVVLPPDGFVKMNEYIMDGTIPVVAGLYFAKCNPASPLVYRGRGNGHYAKWRLGDKVWVDGVPMGCTLIHASLLKVMWSDAPTYVAGGNRKVRKVFDTPSGIYQDPEKHGWNGYAGTEDLSWCNRVIEGGYLKKAGWPKIASKEYPFLIDTSLFCRHITNDGQTFPLSIPVCHMPKDAKISVRT